METSTYHFERHQSQARNCLHIQKIQIQYNFFSKKPWPLVPVKAHSKMEKVEISVISLGLTFFKGISVEDARQGIVYKFREDSYQGKMWFRICMFSASKVYSKDRDANDYKFKYIHSPSDMPAIMRTIAPAEHLSSGNKHEMKTRWRIAANRSKQTTKG